MRPEETVIRSQADLERTWRTLMEPLGFGTECVWLMLIGPDDRPVPRLVEIDECDEPPTQEAIASFARFLRELREQVGTGVRCAFLRTRPGHAGLTPDDLAWARGLYAAGRLAEVPVEIVHRACDVDLVPLPMDDALAEELPRGA